MQVLTKEMWAELKNSADFAMKKEFVEVTSGMGVYVTEVSAEGALALSKLASEEDEDNEQALFHWVAACSVDSEGNKVFTVEDVLKMPHAVAQKLGEAVMKINGLAGKGVEEAEKNSEEAAS